MKHTSLFLFVLIIISIICEANSFERKEIISAQGGGVAQLIAQEVAQGGGVVEQIVQHVVQQALPQIAQDVAEAEQSPHLNLQELVFAYEIYSIKENRATIFASYVVGIFVGFIGAVVCTAFVTGTGIILYRAYYWFYEND